MTSFEAIEKRRNSVVLRLKAGTNVVGPKARVGGKLLGQLLVEVIEVPARDLGQALVQGLVVDIEVPVGVQEEGAAAPQLHMKDLRAVVVRA